MDWMDAYGSPGVVRYNTIICVAIREHDVQTWGPPQGGRGRTRPSRRGMQLLRWQREPGSGGRTQCGGPHLMIPRIYHVYSGILWSARPTAVGLKCTWGRIRFWWGKFGQFTPKPCSPAILIICHWHWFVLFCRWSMVWSNFLPVSWKWKFLPFTANSCTFLTDRKAIGWGVSLDQYNLPPSLISSVHFQSVRFDTGHFQSAHPALWAINIPRRDRWSNSWGASLDQ